MCSLNDVRPFHVLLKHYLARRKLSGNQFSKLADISQSYISACVVGKNAPPVTKIKKWALLLDLSESETAEFTRAALEMKILVNLDNDVRWVFEEMLTKFESQNAATAALLARIASHCADPNRRRILKRNLRLEPHDATMQKRR